MISGTPAFRGSDLRHTYQRVLFADLEFTPEEKFSPDAKTLLTGLLCRDPVARLGAEENPPSDIMDAAFFSSVSWSEVFECSSDGPWLPEVRVSACVCFCLCGRLPVYLSRTQILTTSLPPHSYTGAQS
jgi:hypothetical protein